MRRKQQQTRPAMPATTIAPAPVASAGIRALRIALVVVRHTAPLVALVVLHSSVTTYLLLALFDLGVGYAGHQLRHKAATTRHALESAETATERLFAYLQLPMMMALSGALFIATALLFLLPFLWAPIVGALKTDATSMLASTLVMSVTGAWQLDKAMADAHADDPAFRVAADVGAKEALGLLGLFLLIAGHALSFGGAQRGMWFIAIAFSVALCAKDLGWRGARTR